MARLKVSQGSLLRDVAAERILTTPEGVVLTVHLADRGDRFTALLIDLAISISISAVPLALGVWAGINVASMPALIFAVLVSFLVRKLYFPFFELRWNGQTPGKRWLGLRVIDQSGGHLRPGSIIARNLMREVEVFLPLTLLIVAPAAHLQGHSTEPLALLAWLGLFAALFLLNRDRCRAGDIVGGVWVIRIPRTVLAADLATTAKSRYAFTGPQLDAYGIYELQVLETMLRQPPSAQGNATRRIVSEQISHKIGYGKPPSLADVDRFLNDFYTAQREWLERRMLFGEERTDKNYRADAPR